MLGCIKGYQVWTPRCRVLPPGSLGGQSPWQPLDSHQPASPSEGRGAAQASLRLPKCPTVADMWVWEVPSGWGGEVMAFTKSPRVRLGGLVRAVLFSFCFSLSGAEFPRLPRGHL